MTPIQVITTLHFGEGATVAFARENGLWQECGAIPVVDLPAKWPNIEAHLKRDSYFSLASTYEQKRTVNLSMLGLPKWSRKAECLRWINAIALDVDHHTDQDFSVEALLESFWRELESQNIPYPTFIVLSGRGLWALWQLRDHTNQGQPVPAFPDRRELAQRITRAVIEKLKSLGADRNASDVARVMRLPDSINSKAAPENSRVRFFRVSNTTFTLPELADVLGVRARKVSLPGETRPKNRAKQAAAEIRWRYPLEGFRSLWKMRGVFRKGTRRTAIYVYAVLLRKNRFTPQQVLTACLQLAGSLVPALTADHVRRAIASSEKALHYNFSNARLAEMLKITPQEQQALPGWFRPKAKAKSIQIAERRAIIASKLQAGGGRVSTRRLARLLKEKHGIRMSQSTVAREVRSLVESDPMLKEPRVSLCISRENDSVPQKVRQAQERRQKCEVHKPKGGSPRSAPKNDALWIVTMKTEPGAWVQPRKTV
jgi:hypothetical protein